MDFARVHNSRDRSDKAMALLECFDVADQAKKTPDLLSGGQQQRVSIALSPDTVDLMHDIRGRQMEQQLSIGDAWREFGYVFSEEDGSPVVPDKVTQDFARVVKRLGLPYLSFHGLRHVHATLLLLAGTNPKIVSERLGHSNIAITMDIYSYVLPGLQEAAALAIDKQIGIGHSP